MRVINQTKSKLLKRSVFGVAVSGLILAAQLPGLSQLVGRPDRGFKAGNSYSISDIENINLSGGNVGMTIPLASLPAGRGDASGYSISLQYDSKLWDTQQEWKNDATDEFGAPANYTRNLLQLSNEGGWKLLYGGYQLKVIDRTDSGRREECVLGNTNYSKNSYRLRVEMVTPGGGSITFRPVGYDDQFKDGFFEVDLNGYVFHETLGSTIEMQPYCQVTQYQSTTAGMTYYSTDGSGIRLFVPYYSTGARDWTMYFPDGRIVEYLPPDDPSIFQRVTDRNGNRTVVKGDTYNGLSGTKIEDSVGRFIFVTAVNGDTKIYQFGTAGEALETTIKWKDYWVFRNYRATDLSSTLNIPTVMKRADILQDVRVVDEIILPSQAGSLKYEFAYHASETEPDPQTTNYTNGWGELASVTLPSRAIAEYKYKYPTSEDPLTTAMDIIKNSATQKDLRYSETYGSETTLKTDTWLYSIQNGYATVTAPDGSVTNQSSAYKTPSLKESVPTDWNAGLVYAVTNPDGSRVEKIWEQKGSRTPAQGQPIDPYLKTEFTTITDAAGQPALTAIKDFVYDQNMNVLETLEYDWVAYSSVPRTDGKPTGIPTGAALLRKTINTYHNPTPTADVTTYGANYYANGSSPRLRNLLKSTEVRDGSGTPKARSEFFYDDPNNKGNLTEVRRWDTSTGYGLTQPDGNGSQLNGTNSISSFTQFDQYGNPELTTDANGHKTHITYGSVNGFPGLYPTQTVSAYQTSIARTSSAVYDFTTGLVTTATDVDNSVSTMTVYDALGRPTKVRSAANTPLESWTQTEYDDVSRHVIVRSDLEAVGDARKVATQFYDQLGRVRLSKTLEDPSQSATNETDGIKVETRYKIENGFTYQLTSNPFRAATATQATNEPTMGWTKSKAWSNGRRSEVETFSGAALPGPWGSNANTTGVVVTEIDANAATVTDQAGKVRRSITNALGQLTRVDEPTSASLGAVGSPNQPTSYSYDVLNNLLTVTQSGTGIEQCGPSGGNCSQTRTFTYSSLSRLTSATNPESGTMSYVYEPNGNLSEKTDARGVKTAYVYDQLNRIKERNYSTPGGPPANYQASPNVSYTYRTTAPAIGALASVSTGTGPNTSTTEYVEFDISGRVKRSRQTTDGVTYGGGSDANYWLTYTYNLSGALIEQQYPSGRVVRNTLDANGDLVAVLGRKVTRPQFWAYANGYKYNATGAVTSMQLGNGNWESTGFNARLQPTQIALGKTKDATDLLKLDYSYGTTQNNGNVLSQTITVPTVGQTNGFTAVQNYSYDSLNRLKHADEKPQGWTDTNCTSDPTKCWKQTFDFDRYGNRRFDEANTTMPASFANPAVTNPAINPSNNRLSSTGWSYDPSGNTKNDPSGRSFVYDSENKQVSVSDGSGTVGQYFYDGDGKRVKKVVTSTGETTIFVYDAAGKLVAEYSTLVASTNDAKVAYLTNDHLGSPRINTDANGAVTARHDYHPFGEEIATAQRVSGVGYAADGIRKQFTGYERDNETDLDFAKARMYSNRLGRFTATDPIIISKEHPPNPQRWNLYVYVLNNPLTFTDPDGQKPKRVIDVFLTYETTAEGRAEWKRIKREAARQGVRVNIYRTDNGTATADGFINSIKTKGRTTVLIGHSYSDSQNAAKRKGIGLWFDRPNNQYQAITNREKMAENNLRPGTHTVDGLNARASTVAVFTCNFGSAFDRLGSTNNTNFLRANNGWNGESGLDSLNQAGLRLTKTLAAGGTTRQAQEAATAGFNAFRNETYDSDDSIGLRVLSPVQ